MRQNPLVRLFQSIAAKLLGQGKTRNYFSGASQSFYRLWDLEIPEQIIRQNGSLNAREVVEMCIYCPPVVKALRILAEDIFSSADGDDQGVAIAEDLGDAKATPVDPKIKDLGNALLNRVGLETQKLIAKRLLSYGDAFVEKVLIREGGRYSIHTLKVLPTWQLFRCEDDYGNLNGFEQRLSLYGLKNNIEFSPPQIIHARYDREFLYGRGLFDASVPDWQNLKAAALTLSEALKGTVNPLTFVMPQDWTAEQKDAYIRRRAAEQQQGMLQLLFTTTDVEVKRLAQGNSSLTSLTDGILYYRRAIKDNSRLPSWFWTDEAVNGSARDIAGQPALTYARFIAGLRGIMGQALRQAIDTELVLAGYLNPEQRQYRLAWPAIYTDPQSQVAAAEEGEGIAPEEQEPTIEMVLNGRH